MGFYGVSYRSLNAENLTEYDPRGSPRDKLAGLAANAQLGEVGRPGSLGYARFLVNSDLPEADARVQHGVAQTGRTGDGPARTRR